jgi:seryl-tRNA synthetase
MLDKVKGDKIVKKFEEMVKINEENNNLMNTFDNVEFKLNKLNKKLNDFKAQKDLNNIQKLIREASKKWDQFTQNHLPNPTPEQSQFM